MDDSNNYIRAIVEPPSIVEPSKEKEVTIRRAPPPDEQPYDEISIITVPRYKTSDASGDEWRISAKVQLKRKGRVVYEEDFGKLQPAAMQVASVWYNGMDNFASLVKNADVCDQEGCSKRPEVTYRMKKMRDESTREMVPVPEGIVLIRKFCPRHSTRGNCGLEDADDNYELVDGSDLPTKVAKQDKSKSATIFI